MKLLLVEDDALLGDGVRAGLKQAGFAVDWVQDGLAAKVALDSEDYDLLVLDLGLPKLSGMELLKSVRAKRASLPVLILTARDTVADRVAGLNAGADDYLVKPFDLDELIARLNALLRRSAGQVELTLQHGAIELTPASHQVRLAGTDVSMSAREFSLLHTLLLHTGRVHSREQLEQTLYGWGEEVESNAIEVHVHHLRKKLGSDLIRTLRGVGYVIDKVA
ncbi:OmpR Response regulators consisting of a CheY-like receiver domain and a winged-helix DNA-binding domain [Methylophilaceae bacterium]|jgi:DNA-binding response OmpR family regulator